MSEILFPHGLRIELLSGRHDRTHFRSGEAQVDDWLATKALQNQEKRLSTTKVLVDDSDTITGYYTLATAQVDFGELPPEIRKRLPRRALPVAVPAWLGVALTHRGQGLGQRLLGQALRDCFEAGRAFAFVAVVLDCLNDPAKAFYQHFDFQEMPGHPYRLFLGAKRLEAMMTSQS